MTFKYIKLYCQMLSNRNYSYKFVHNISIKDKMKHTTQYILYSRTLVIEIHKEKRKCCDK